jgi:hypothetical protein
MRRFEAEPDGENDDAQAASENAALVWVRPQHRDWRQAAFRLSDLQDVSWGDPLDEAFLTRLYAHVWCDAMVDGERLHACKPVTAPHRLRVCVLRRDNEAMFERLRELCGEPPWRAR